MAIRCRNAPARMPWSAATRRVKDTRRISGLLLDRADSIGRHPHRGAAGEGDSASRRKAVGRAAGRAVGGHPQAGKAVTARRRGRGRRPASRARGCWPMPTWGRGRYATSAGWTTSLLEAGIGKSLLKAAMQQLHMSARAYHRILKLARTMARKAGLGPGGERRDPDGASCGGDSVSAKAANVTPRTVPPWWLGGVPWLSAAGAPCFQLL